VVRQTQADVIRAVVLEAEQIIQLKRDGKNLEANEIIKSGKWTAVLNGKVLVKGLVEIRANEQNDYDVFIAGYRVHLPF